MFNSAGMHVLDVRQGHRKLVITVETDADASGCRGGGVVATGHGRRRVTAADAPCFGIAVLIIWLNLIWRCDEPDCATGTWSETHDLIAPRAVLLTWAEQLADGDTLLWAIEDCRHVSRRLERDLLAAGQSIVRCHRS